MSNISIFCTKYRCKIFCNAKYKNLCEILIAECCKRHTLNLTDFEVNIDHVNVLVSIPLTMTPTKEPKLRKLYSKGHLWSNGKFIGSVGHITIDKAKEYVSKHNLK